MSFAKSFGLSLVIFIGLNVIFFFIGAALIEDGLDIFFNLLEADLIAILEPLFGPIYTGLGPEAVLSTALSVSDPELGFIVLLIGYITAPLVAAILAGKFAENKSEALLGWFLSAMVSAVIVLSWVAYVMSDAGATTEDIIDSAIFTAGLSAIIGIFYGCFALIFTKSEYF